MHIERRKGGTCIGEVGEIGEGMERCRGNLGSDGLHRGMVDMLREGGRKIGK